MSEDIQIPETVEPPKILPENGLDNLALKRAKRRFEHEAKMTKLREWMVYEAPNGFYDMFIEEREALLKEEADDIRNAKIWGAIVCCIVIGIFADVLYELYEVTTRLP